MRTVRLIALLALAALPGLMGCTHTQQVSRTATAAPSDEQTGRWKAVREIKEASREHVVTVVTLGGRNYRARSVQLQTDTLSWLSPDEEVLRRVPFADVHAVEWESYGRGALEGAFPGLLLGVAGGAIVATPFLLLGVNMQSGAGLAFGALGIASGLVVAGGGLLIGVLMGAASGSTTRYVFNDDANEERTP